MSRASLRLIAVACAAGVTASLLASAAAGTPRQPEPAQAQVEAPVPKIHWRACRGAERYDCARVRVPLDYDKPAGEEIALRLLRDPANKPGQRIGSLFVNPGGPGGSSADFVPGAAHYLGKKVRQRFDIIGVDPRGVGGSAHGVCKGPWPKPPRRPRLPFPFERKAERRWIKADNDLRAFCREYHNPVLDHMSTADTARDMDLVRQALGDDKLTYYGASYGTYLGATYAAMFPDRVRALILDGVLDPVAWSTGRGDSGKRLPFATRLRSGYGAYEALTAAFAECARVGRRRCGAKSDIAQKWRTVIRKSRRHKIVIDGSEWRYEYIVGDALSGLYSQPAYRWLMQYVSYLHRVASTKRGTRAHERAGNAAQRLSSRLRKSRATVPGPYATAVAAAPARTRRYDSPFLGVSCSDSVNPKRSSAWVEASERDDFAQPWFGRLWTWQASSCARWPGSSADAFRGPWNVEPSAPVLLIANSHDPATPISGARAANRLLDGSRLLMLDGWGHAAIGESECVTNKMSRYLVAQRLPAAGTVCKPDRQLFPPRKR